MLAARLARYAKTESVLTMFVAVTSLAILGQTWWAITQDRRLTLMSEKEHGLVAVRLLEEHANQQLIVAAERLNAIAVGAAQIVQDRPLAQEQVANLIENYLKTSRSDAALQFINPAGRRWVSMFDFPAFVFPKEPRDYIPYLLAHPQLTGIVAGRPFKRKIDGALILPLARNMVDHNGDYAGLIGTEIELMNFKTVYERVAKSNNAVAELIGADGFVIVRSPFEDKAVNRDISKSALLRQLAAAPAEGAMEDTPLLEEGGATHLATYRRVQGFPMVIVFGRAMDDILANWRARTVDRMLFSGIFVALHLLLTYYLLLHMRRLHDSGRLLSASEARFVSLFQSAPIALALMRFDTSEIIEANDAMLRQFGFSRAEFIGRTPLQLGLWHDPAAREPYVELLRAQGFVDRYEALLQYRDGRAAMCLLSTRLIELGGTTVGIFSPADVSRLREVEQEIRALNSELEVRVEQRTEKLQEALATVKNMQGELVRSEKMAALGSLVAGVAHELNTPVGNSVTVTSTIFEHAASLRDELQSERPRRSQLGSLSEAILGGADILSRNLGRVVTLVASFKQVAVDQSSDQRRLFDLTASIDDVLRALAPMMRPGKISMELDLTPGLRMDSYPGALSQIITNFVSNVVNHAFEGRAGGRVWLSTRALELDWVELQFRDDGCGIAAEHLSRVFDPFFTTKLGQGGSGLGMNIVYNLVTGVLGGTISLRSTVGEGTCLVVRLPRQAPTLGR